MSLAELFVQYADRLHARYALTPDQRAAMWAIINCRTHALGDIVSQCPHCNKVHLYPHSCGHRSCPVCQHGTTTDWIARQQQKLLPVKYYMITFTVPMELRPIAARHPKIFYTLMFKAAKQTLMEVAATPRHLGATPGFTAVLHTHSRRLDLHPHIHVVIPKGGVDLKQNIWRTNHRKTLFHIGAIKALWRGKMLSFLKQEGIAVATAAYKKDWVCNIKAAGSGEPALLYLSKYLYRGVIQERNIVSHQNGTVTFAYRDSASNLHCTRTMPAEDFLYRVLLHVLPKGFRRTRDFGFLHGNAKRTLRKVQLLLKTVPGQPVAKKPTARCSICNHELVVIACKVFRKNTSPERGPP